MTVWEIQHLTIRVNNAAQKKQKQMEDIWWSQLWCDIWATSVPYNLVNIVNAQLLTIWLEDINSSSHDAHCSTLQDNLLRWSLECGKFITLDNLKILSSESRVPSPESRVPSPESRVPRCSPEYRVPHFCNTLAEELKVQQLVVRITLIHERWSMHPAWSNPNDVVIFSCVVEVL